MVVTSYDSFSSWIIYVHRTLKGSTMMKSGHTFENEHSTQFVNEKPVGGVIRV